MIIDTRPLRWHPSFPRPHSLPYPLNAEAVKFANFLLESLILVEESEKTTIRRNFEHFTLRRNYRTKFRKNTIRINSQNLNLCSTQNENRRDLSLSTRKGVGTLSSIVVTKLEIKGILDFAIDRVIVHNYDSVFLSFEATSLGLFFWIFVKAINVVPLQIPILPPIFVLLLSYRRIA